MTTTTTTSTITSPFDGAVVGHAPEATADDAEQAVLRAVAAFPAFKALPRFALAEILERAASLLQERADEFARLIVLEAGKPLYDAQGEVSRSVFNLRNAAAEARRFGGEEVPLDVDRAVADYQIPPEARADGGAHDGRTLTPLNDLASVKRRIGIVRRYPTGPVLAITPFNFPLNLVLHKVAPSLAVGAPVILKPAPQTPLTSFLLAELLTDAGLPEGALSVVHCSVEVAESLVRDPRIAVVSFTGSAKVGWHLKAIAGHKKVLLELGGNGAVIVHDDADLEQAVKRCVRGGVVFAGQYCIGVQRILVHRSLYERFLTELVDEVSRCTVGDPLDPATKCGPVIDERSADRIESWIEAAVDAGAKVEIGGERAGNIISPTVLTNTSAGMSVEDEEIFGPVVTLNAFDTLDEAVTRANASRFGLQAGLFTNDMRAAMQVADELEVGALIVNDAPIFRIDSMPFGGWKESGFGREGTRYAMEEMTESKLLVLNYS